MRKQCFTSSTQTIRKSVYHVANVRRKPPNFVPLVSRSQTAEYSFLSQIDEGREILVMQVDTRRQVDAAKSDVTFRSSR